MKSRVFRIFVFSMASFLGCLAPSLAFGQWHPDSSQNTAVCDTVGQQDAPQGCTDGANGAIFVWEDARLGPYQIYAQHMDMNGRAKWNRNGVKLATASSNPSQTNPIITTDDSGGAYVVWLDSRNTVSSTPNGICLFAQHILANGTLAYPDTGLPVAIGLNGCQNPTLCDDGFGGAFVAWEDNRALNASTRPDIWMNRLWRGSVKYGLTTTGTQGIVTIVNTGTKTKPKDVTYFHDPNANFQNYMVNLFLAIPGQGTFQISGITNDTQVTLKSGPSGNGPFSYYVGNLTGLAIDTMPNKQSGPCIINDGNGGSFLAWTTNSTSPNSIYGTHLDSTCKALWDPAPKPGFQFYTDNNAMNPSQNVSLNRDGNQLLLAWQVTNPGNTGQEIYAQRMRCNTPLDTTFEWGNASDAIDVTSNQILDQTTPQIFSDDSVGLGGLKGAIVPFLDEEPGGSGYDISMARVLGVSQLLPPAGNGFWFFEQNQLTNNDFQVVKITDPANAGTNTGLLAVWDEEWDGKDTMIYAQRMDRAGHKYFPTAGTPNKWGQVISGDGGPTHRWTARQPCLVPRTDGAIVGWTDFRSGTAAIYCQLILMDGTFWIPSDTTPPSLTVVSSTPPDNDSACNSQCTNVIAIDGGSLISGIDSVIPMAMTNMQLETSSFLKGADSVAFSVCVMDSFQDGRGTVMVEDTAMNIRTINFTYCTILDTSTPVITVDTISTNPYVLSLQIQDNGPWARGLRSITTSNNSNIKFSDSIIKITSREGMFYDTARITDLSVSASFTIKGIDTANKSVVYNFNYTPQSGVTQSVQDLISISVFPNPTNGDATVLLNGAPSADVTVSDVLGRTVDQFRLEGSHVWQTGSLPTGTYIVRALIGDIVVCKRIVRE
jgi:hypothetical protein